MLSLLGEKSVWAVHDRPGERRDYFAGWRRRAVAMCLAFLAGSSAGAASSPVRGMPFIRSYSLGDIGSVPRGSRLGFDRFGRVAVIHDSVYAVLNDTVWLNIAEPGGNGHTPIGNVVQAPDGRTYYGARSSWGYVEVGTDGRLHPVPLVPASVPDWMATASFKDLIVTNDGVYFASWNGMVYWDFRRKKSFLVEVPRISRMFQVGDRVYISAFDTPLRYFDVAAGTIESAAGTELDNNIVEFSATLDFARSLVAFTDGRVMVFDGRTLAPWLSPENNVLNGHVAVMQQLVDGRVAIGVTGQGLLLFSTEGELLMALTTSQYHNIMALANREPGVLWAETEDAVEKILYGSPLSAFGQRLGLPIAWPIVVVWNGQTIVASDGRLYQAVPGDRGEATHFELCANQPPRGAWALAAWGSHMLVGNGYELFGAEPDGTLQPIESVGHLAHLVMVDENRCYVVGRSEIALLEWRDGRWIETVPRIAGVANPSIVHRVMDSVWIEMGGDGVARLWTHDGRLQLDVISNASWTKGTWVNIGSVDDIVVLSALREEPHRFFDQKTGAWCEAPELQQLLDRSPFWIARLEKDESGVIWAAHNEGLVRFAPTAHGYEMDANSYDLVNDRYPVVRILPGNDVWVAAERSLFHLERTWVSVAPQPAKPTLVSLVDLQRNEELLPAGFPSATPLRFPYAKNSLSFRFFSGTDAWRRSPAYEYRLSENEPWTMLDGSLLSFRRLREGNYRLQARIAAAQSGSDGSATFEFEILPPWHRTWPAYTLFGSGVLLALLGMARWSSYLERRRNRELEQVVKKRTHQLETTMARLGEETRKAATLSERDRLANEIHDSVQQGLTGAILQLDTTLKLPAVGGDVRSRLNVVRNMVSYARQEVQHAVWDMESPLLEGTELADALRNLTTFVSADGVTIEVSVEGEPVPLGRDTDHNLLRIAQEATTNAIRHASASRISLNLIYGADFVSLVVADDGIGFSAGEVLQDRTGHLGLRGIRTRVKKLGGELTIDSVPGQGTTIRIVVPLSAADLNSIGNERNEENPNPAGR